MGVYSNVALSKYALLTGPLTVSHSISLTFQGLGQYADEVGMTFSLEMGVSQHPSFRAQPEFLSS